MATWKNPAFRSAGVVLEEMNYNPVSAHWDVGTSTTFSGYLTNINLRNFPEANHSLLFPVGSAVPVTKELIISTPERTVDVYLAYDPPVNGF